MTVHWDPLGEAPPLLFNEFHIAQALEARRSEAVASALQGEPVSPVNAHTIVEQFHTILPKLRDEPTRYHFEESAGEVLVTADLAFDGDAQVFYWHLDGTEAMENATAKGSRTSGNLTVWRYYSDGVRDSEIRGWVGDVHRYVEHNLARFAAAIAEANRVLLSDVQHALQRREAAARRAELLSRTFPPLRT